MFGAILGDTAGSRFEFTNNRRVPDALWTSECFPTDDSYLTVEVQRALILPVKSNEELIQRVLRGTLRTYLTSPRNAGWGAGFSKWCRRTLAENGVTQPDQLFDGRPLTFTPNKSLGNGCAMKISPVPYVVETLEQCKEYTRVITSVTHDHEESYHAAECLTTSMYMALNGKTRDQIRHNITEYYPEVASLTWEGLHASYQYSELARDTLPAAMVCFLESKSFDDAIGKAISIGGDADTLGAITGALAEAFYGWDKKRCNEIYNVWFDTEFGTDSMAEVFDTLDKRCVLSFFDRYQPRFEDKFKI